MHDKRVVLHKTQDLASKSHTVRKETLSVSWVLFFFMLSITYQS